MDDNNSRKLPLKTKASLHARGALSVDLELQQFPGNFELFL